MGSAAIILGIQGAMGGLNWMNIGGMMLGTIVSILNLESLYKIRKKNLAMKDRRTD